MKKIKLIILSFLTIVGIGGALATSHRAAVRAGAVTYFAVQTISGYTWVTVNSIPNGYACQEGGTACTVISDNGSRPADNTAPSGANFHYSDTGSEYKPLN